MTEQTVFKARAPMRVDPAGGGTDCPPYCLEHEGAVLNFGVGLYARATVKKLPGTREIIVRSLDFDIEVRAPSVGKLALEGPLDLLAGFVRRAQPDFGLELTVMAEAPPGSGLGSSGAVGVACMAALQAAQGMPVEAEAIAAEANRVEREDLGHAGGSQDSFGAALGGFNLIHYLDGGRERVQRLSVSQATRRLLEERCVLVYTGEAHLSSSIHEDIRTNYAQPGSPTLDAMHQLARLARDGAALIEEGQVDAFGELLNESWRQLKRLHPSCDSERLRSFFAAAQPLMVGGKACGAAGGGCILFLAREGERQALADACQTLDGALMPFRIDMDGVVIA